MSRISRYQDSMTQMVTVRSSYCELLKYENNKNETCIANVGDHEAAITLLTILNGHNKKGELKLHHGYFMGAGIDLMMLYNKINDNPEYYIATYGEKFVKNIQSQTAIHVFDCMNQNIETLEDFLEKSKLTKLHKKIASYLKQKLVEIMSYNKIIGTKHMHKTDIIKFKFDDFDGSVAKYKTLKLVDRPILISHINKTYGATCQCAFVVGWLLGLGDPKMIVNLEKLGTHLGMLLKLSEDFVNLERDIKYSDKRSLNMLVNYGVHESFDLFLDSKVKLIEGTMLLGIYNTTIKEIIDFIEKKFDKCLNNTELEVESRYSSFSNMSQM